MATIVLANPKGGAGKSTTSMILATSLAAQDCTVTVLDCDPNRPIMKWGARRSTPSPVRILGDVTEANVIKVLEQEASTQQFVIVDLEGTASRLVSRAITRADLVIVPVQPSPLDAGEAARALALVVEEEEVLRRRIPAAIVLTRTNPAIKSKIEKSIMRGLAGAGIIRLETNLHQRSAYQAMFATGQTLEELDPAEVNGIGPAQSNALAFASEVLALMNTLNNPEPVGESRDHEPAV